jgi:hypothetical protein
MAITRGPKIVRDGLVLYLDAGDRNSYPGSGTTWKDLSGNGNNGTLTNGPTFDSGNGGSISFDGTDDYISMTDKNPSFINSTFPNGLNISFTIKLSNDFSANDGRTILTRNSGAAGTNAFNLSVQSTKKLRFWLANGGTSIVFSNTILNTNEVYIGCLNWDGSTADFFLQGVLDSSTSYAVTPTISTHNTFNIGYWGHAAGWEFNGNIYNVQFYNRALSAAEILQNYNTVKGRFNL